MFVADADTACEESIWSATVVAVSSISRLIVVDDDAGWGAVDAIELILQVFSFFVERFWWHFGEESDEVDEDDDEQTEDEYDDDEDDESELMLFRCNDDEDVDVDGSVDVVFST